MHHHRHQWRLLWRWSLSGACSFRLVSTYSKRESRNHPPQHYCNKFCDHQLPKPVAFLLNTGLSDFHPSIVSYHSFGHLFTIVSQIASWLLGRLDSLTFATTSYVSGRHQSTSIALDSVLTTHNCFAT